MNKTNRYNGISEGRGKMKVRGNNHLFKITLITELKV
jgi:hypothetical protein